MKEKKVCDHCGALMIEYRYSLNKGLAVVLGKLFDAGGPVEVSTLKLTNPQYSNAPKVRYWGLAEQVINKDTMVKRGVWKITQKGVDFVLGKTMVPQHAVTYRNTVIRIEGAMVEFKKISDGYLYRADYAEMARSQILKLTDSGQYEFL